MKKLYLGIDPSIGHPAASLIDEDLNLLEHHRASSPILLFKKISKWLIEAKDVPVAIEGPYHSKMATHGPNMWALGRSVGIFETLIYRAAWHDASEIWVPAPQTPRGMVGLSKQTGVETIKQAAVRLCKKKWSEKLSEDEADAAIIAWSLKIKLDSESQLQVAIRFLGEENVR